jgi:hypothetical protein
MYTSELSMRTRSRFLPVVASLALLAIASCDNGPGAPASIAVNAGDNQTAEMGTKVAIPPSVLVTDKDGAPIPDVALTFTPTLGSGSVTGVSSTAADGIATADDWELGCNVTNSLVVRVRDYSGVSGDPLTFTAHGVGGDCWDVRAPFPERFWMMGVAGLNGKIYSVGGAFGHLAPSPQSYVAAYDPSTDTWTPKAPIPTPRWSIALVAMNGILYAIGGKDHGVWDQLVQAYDPTSDTWTAKTPMSVARHFRPALAAVDGILYAFGGCSSAPCASETYDPTTDTWTMKPPPPTGFYPSGAGVINGVIYLNGGCDVPPCAMQAYDPSTDSWSSRATLPEPFGSFVVANSVLYSMGATLSPGTGHGWLIPAAYDPATDTWTTKAPRPLNRNGFGVGAIDGTIYVVGGITPGAPDHTEAYHP